MSKETKAAKPAKSNKSAPASSKSTKTKVKAKVPAKAKSPAKAKAAPAPASAKAKAAPAPASAEATNLRKQPILVPKTIKQLIDLVGEDATVLVGRKALTDQVAAGMREEAMAKVNG